MTDFVFNVAKGSVAAYARNVDTNSPTNSALIVHVFDMAGATENSVKDADTIAAVEAVASVTELTTNGWTRKTLVDTDVTVTVDDTNDRVDIDIPDQTWTAVSAGTSTSLVISYDADTGAGTDSDLIPLTHHDFAVTPDGSDVTAVINAAGFFRAS